MVSIRSKSLRKQKAIKRSTNFGEAEIKRLQRIAAKLKDLKTHIPAETLLDQTVGGMNADCNEATQDSSMIDNKPTLMNRNQIKRKNKAKRLSKKR